MVLSASEAVNRTSQLIDVRRGESDRLDRIHNYVNDEQRLAFLRSGVPAEVRQLADMSRVNVLGFVVSAATQSLYVDGFNTPEGGDQPAWNIWQINRFDARQIGVHRAALTYGVAYTTVLPGDTAPVIRGVSPRNMTAMYAPDADWPEFALEKRTAADGDELWRLFDADATYWLATNGRDRLEHVRTETHGLGVTPVIRYVPTGDLDNDVSGSVEPLVPLQDQINVTTFVLQVAMHYAAHRQRYILGWLAESESQKIKASAAKLWTFEDESIEVGEFEQTDPSGMIESREASLRHVATTSQTPVHELLGSLANLSAEALVASRDSHTRKLEEHKTMLGESHEQTLQLAGRIAEIEVQPGAWVRWRDMAGRSIAQVADALGKMAESLGIPPQALWDRAAESLKIPDQEVERWKSLAREGDTFAQLTEMLDRQMDSA